MLTDLRGEIHAEGPLQRQQTGEYEDAGTTLDAESVDVALEAAGAPAGSRARFSDSDGRATCGLVGALRALDVAVVEVATGVWFVVMAARMARDRRDAADQPRRTRVGWIRIGTLKSRAVWVKSRPQCACGSRYFTR